MATVQALKYQRGVTDTALNPAARTIGATSTTLYSASVDLGTAYSTGKNPRIADIDLRIVVDAQTSTTLPNGQTIVVDLQHSTDDSSFTTLLDNVITVTGTGSSVAQTARQFPIPPDANRYIRLAVTTDGSGTGRDSTYATLSLRV